VALAADTIVAHPTSVTGSIGVIMITLNAEGLTFLVVEHDMNLVMRLCDPIVVLDHGAKIAEGAAAEVRANPVVLEAYLGD